MKLINIGKRSGKTLCYEKEYRRLEKSNKSELVDKIIYQHKIIIAMSKDMKQLRDELLDYELQNKKLQEELVNLIVNAGKKHLESKGE